MSAYEKTRNCFSLLKICIYILGIYFKQVRDIYKVYNKHTTNFILKHKYIKKLLRKPIPIYHHRSKEPKRLVKKSLYIVSDKTFYQMRALKIILLELLNYDYKIKRYLIKIQNCLRNMVETQKLVIKVYQYLLNSIYTNEKGKDDDFNAILIEALEQSPFYG